MNTLNKRRSGDENIGKLIVFAITIVIAIGLVGLVSYFYTQSRETSMNVAILGSTASTTAEIQAIKKTDNSPLSDCSAPITYNALTDIYTASGGTACTTALGLVKGVTVSGSGYTLAK